MLSYIIIYTIVAGIGESVPCGQVKVVPVPDFIHTDKTFDASSCGLAKFPENFPSDAELFQVLMINNEFVTFTIPEERNVTYIYLINLSGNRLVSFPNLTTAAYGVRKIVLVDNQITSVDPDLLTELASLAKLDLSKNLLSSLPDVYVPTQSIAEIYLNNNQFTEFPKLRFLGKKTDKLHLYGNSIGDFDINDDGIFPVLSILYIPKNQMTRCPNISDLGDTLTELDLSDNPIGHLPLDILEAMVVLETLKVGKTDLGQFPDLTPVGDTLTFLTVNDNGISHIPRHLLEPLEHLKFISLVTNRFTQFPDLTPVLDTLITIKSSDWGDDMERVFRMMAGTNMKLELRYARYSSIPHILCDAGQRFSHIGLQMMPLVCDCRLRWLKVATLSGQSTDIENYAACRGGPDRLINTLWRDITLSDLVCEAPTVTYRVTEVDYTCVDMPADEVELGTMTRLGCAHACRRHASCFMFRYKDGGCGLIVQGQGRMSNLSNLYKVV